MPYPDETDAEFYDRRAFEKKMSAGGKKFPCPTCGRKNALTRAEAQKGYQCDKCADAEERKQSMIPREVPSPNIKPEILDQKVVQEFSKMIQRLSARLQGKKPPQFAAGLRC